MRNDHDPEREIDHAAVERVIAKIAQRRDAGATVSDANALMKAAREATAGAVDDASRSTVLLRKLRRQLYTLYDDSYQVQEARRLIALATPPERNPDAAPAQAEPSTPRERTQWLNGALMVAMSAAEMAEARALIDQLVGAYQANPDPTLFPVLSSAAQASFELGDLARGRELVRQMEEEAGQFPDADLRGDVLMAKRFEHVLTGDVAGYMALHVQLKALLPQTMSRAADHAAALACLQMNDPAAAARVLPARPSEDEPVGDLAADAMVRLQTPPTTDTQTGHEPEGRKREHHHPDDIARAISILAHPEAQTHYWALCGVLSECLFRAERVGEATLLATLFIRHIHIVAETLPQQSLEQPSRRMSILRVLEPLQAALLWAGYLRAAEDVAELRTRLDHPTLLPRDFYARWAPSLPLGETADAIETRRASPENKDGEWCAALINGASLPAMSRASFTPRGDEAHIAFIPEGARLIRIVTTQQSSNAQVLEAQAEEISKHTIALHAALRHGAEGGGGEDLEARGARLALGAHLLHGLEELLIAHTGPVTVAPHGPVAQLPFAAVQIPGSSRLLGDVGTALSIRTTARREQAHPARPAHADRRAVSVFFARGVDDRLLPFAEVEAQAVKDAHKTHGSAVAPGRPILDGPSLREALLARPDILHVITDFTEGTTGDLAASTLMADDGAFFRLADILDRELDLSGVRVIYLSACDSAGLKSGAGVPASLAAALLNLGVSDVIATIASIKDSAAATLAERIHQQLATGASAPEAVTAAQRALRDQGAPLAAWGAVQCFSA
ncbi:MAG: CHAT domain-containing protein [Pseudomonadota bacterium]